MTKEKAEKLYKKVSTFILSCVDKDGYPLTKAVVPGKFRDSLNEMYFCTNSSSNFAKAVNNSKKASVYFYKKQLLFIWKGCYLKGNIEIVEDKLVKEKYWQQKYKNAYDEKNYLDPDFCVLKFIPTKGRLYQNFEIKDFEI